ncbi:hypothetical protein GCM10009804_14900 [Kribbella hippodromi]|uniref:DoxX family protein n=1 Tax=Kribbella hippodromi TaxID=434347 RepID=A0ABN2CK15_9ACTN
MSEGVVRSVGRSGARVVAVWLVQGGLAVQFAVGGASKLFGVEAMVRMFDDIGGGQWLRVAVGLLELAGAISLLVPRLAAVAAGGLILLMAGAAVTNVVFLGTAPTMPLVFGILAGVVAYARRRQLVVLVRR